MLWLWGVTLLAVAEALKLDFVQTSTTDEHILRQRDERLRGLGLPIFNDLPHQRYLVNLTVGTPPQHFALTVDTGSADLWVPSPNSTACAPHCPPGTFDPMRSSTYKATGLLFNASYGLTPGLAIEGPYFTDTVGFGRAVLPNVTIGLGNVPPQLYAVGFYGFVGLGSPLQEALIANPSSPNFRNTSASFPLLYDQLYQHGYINKRLFSIWMNDGRASTGSILFGDIDSSKYRGHLRYVPLVTSGPPPGVFTGWAVNLTSVSLRHGKHSMAMTQPNTTLTTVLDSGSPNMYLPSSIADAVAQDMNATMHQGFPYVSCSLHSSPKTLEFGFGGARGPIIQVPYREIIYPYGDPANIGPVRGSDGQRLCYLGLIATEGPIYLLGATFIRAAYVVYDVDHLQIGMAPARYGT